MTLYWNFFFYLGPNDTLPTLEWKNIVYGDFIFHLGSIEPSIKLKNIAKNKCRLGSLKSYNPTDPEQSQKFLKDSDRFRHVGS